MQLDSRKKLFGILCTLIFVSLFCSCHNASEELKELSNEQKPSDDSEPSDNEMDSELDILRSKAIATLRVATEFFREEVSYNGGYLWLYDSELKCGEGEFPAKKTTVWVEPPSTPTVGDAYLLAYIYTGDAYYLEGAIEAAEALIHGQLVSGGWDRRIEFAAEDRVDQVYLVDLNVVLSEYAVKYGNYSILDDNITQSALRFLMRLDQVLGFKNDRIHEAVFYALESLLSAQYPNGAWPQRYCDFPDPTLYPVLPASYPASWSRTYPKEKYYGYYTFNDDVIQNMIETFIEAAVIYNDERLREAVLRAGDFIILAQMPEPQPAWAQQYDFEMHPAWARKFEPPAVTGWESQSVLRSLLSLYDFTGVEKYLSPIPSALEYLKNSLLPDGKVARFYELETNLPLFFTTQYELTYDDSDLPSHYGFTMSSYLQDIETEYSNLWIKDAGGLSADDCGDFDELKIVAQEVVDSIDARGAWIEPGNIMCDATAEPFSSVISTETFVNNINVLACYISTLN